MFIFSSCLLNIPLQVIYGTLLALVGLLIYANFAIEQCDPYLSGAITNNNQVSFGEQATIAQCED